MTPIALATKKGLFEEAEGGTILLDEIGSMPMSLQSKLLRVLQEREIRRVGGNKTVPVDVRVIAASNEDLEEGIKAGNFREDLYYRLSVIPILIGPLRERREDILPLIDHFLRDFYGASGQIPSVDADVQKVLESYAWPGNVRELENAVRHACTFCKDGKISKDDLPAKVLAGSASSGSVMIGEASIEEQMGKSLKAFLRQKEKEYLSSVIAYYEGDKEKAAKALKISLATLYRKLPETVE